MSDSAAAKRKGLSLGPGVLVTAAFIGPGTVTTCVLAGQNFGTALLWVLIFATVATILLQEMAARLGAGARSGLGEALAGAAGKGPVQWAALGLVFTAIVIGNVAYEGGNLVGASLGFDALLASGGSSRGVVVPVLAAIAAAILLPGKYRLVERVLVGFVLIMSLAFLIAAVMAGTGPGDLARGLVPRVPEGGLLPLIALLGTTIVPYNLFLHAAAAKRRFAGEVVMARRDTVLAVGLGGLVSASILVTGAAAGEGAGGAAGLAAALEPAFGAASRWLIGIGLLAAGLSSAITAPMAAGYVASELFGRGEERRGRTIFRATAVLVLVAGAFTGSLGIRPETLILLAQAANGLLLPVVGVFLLVMMNRKRLLGDHANGLWTNIAGGAVVMVTLFFGLRGLARAFGVWP